MQTILKDTDKIQWSPHSFANGVEVKHLISKKEEGIDVTCMLVHIPKDKEIPEHSHESQADILFPLKGQGIIWIEDVGDCIIKPGTSVFVACGKKHRIYSVQDDLLVYDVFCPAII